MRLTSLLFLCPFLFYTLTFTILLGTATSAQSPFLPSNPWETFLNFSGCRLGDSFFGLSFVKRYLSHFGYLPSSEKYDDYFDEALETALLAYQENFRLNVTGFLDLSTIELMTRPRCGVPDMVNGTSMMHGRNLFAYFPGKPTWPRGRRHLTYTFSTSGVSIDQKVLSAVFSRAFARWAEATRLSFTEVDSVDQADIVLQFMSGHHGDGEPFDGILGTLAHAFSPTDGRLHFDAAELWIAVESDEASPLLTSSSRAIDLESVAVHEIGHILGLGHSSVANSIMYPSIRLQTRKVQLEADDVQGIQGLYGNNPNYNGTYSGSLSNSPLVEDDGAVALLASSGDAVWMIVLCAAVMVVVMIVS